MIKKKEKVSGSSRNLFLSQSHFFAVNVCREWEEKKFHAGWESSEVVELISIFLCIDAIYSEEANIRILVFIRGVCVMWCNLFLKNKKYCNFFEKFKLLRDHLEITSKRWGSLRNFYNVNFVKISDPLDSKKCDVFYERSLNIVFFWKVI